MNTRIHKFIMLLLLCAFGILPQSVFAQSTAKGTVAEANGETIPGASVVIKGTTTGTVTDIDGNFTLSNVPQGATLVVSFIGYASEEVVFNGQPLQIVLKEASTELDEVVVTAMGIARKATSLTYATQQIKSEDIMRVESPSVANNLEGKISGITVTASAGGAGGASKILLRGNKSILGNNAPLIVVDGIPMQNGTRGQIGASDLLYTSSSEGGDALSQINPDDIESINVLKGANAAALYGSAAANGVVMITTKKGKEGKLSVTLLSNATFETPLLLPKIQNVYGGSVDGNGALSQDSWGDKLSGVQDTYTVAMNNDTKFPDGTHDIHLRNYAKNDLKDFYRLGMTFNNSIALSGGTEKVKTYFSYANAHANGMIAKNTYNKNTFAFRQTYNLWKDRVKVESSVNYVQTVTRNRPGGGTVLSSIYDLYLMPRNVDYDYYKENYLIQDGQWKSGSTSIYVLDEESKKYDYKGQEVMLEGPMQDWVYQAAGKNNPFWLLNQNTGQSNEDRVYGSVSASVKIGWGFSAQARAFIDHGKFASESQRYATTWLPSAIDSWGVYNRSVSQSNDLYADYLLTYDNTFGDFSVNATAGYVNHMITGRSMSTAPVARQIDASLQSIPKVPNYFTTRAGGVGTTNEGRSSNWDKAALFTAQFGWKDVIYIDGSYRRDWYRAFKQFAHRGTPDNYGYFGVGASAIISSLMNNDNFYMKYRLSYSEVGNSIPNTLFSTSTMNLVTGTASSSGYAYFENPIPEKTKSFETGIDMAFLRNALNVDLTYYNSAMCNSYLVIASAGGQLPVNTGKIRNQGIEATIGYDWVINKNWRWRTSLNASYNHNRIISTYHNEEGQEVKIHTNIASGTVQVRYNEGDAYGDMYIHDWYRDDTGNIRVTAQGLPKIQTAKPFSVYAGNMNPKYQLGWTNSFSYKGLNIYFLINGRIGGKVISFTEAYLDNYGLSQRTADARLEAERIGLYTKEGKHAMYIPGDEQKRLIGVEDYYRLIGGEKKISEYLYSATNFRLRELSIGYTFSNLFGEGRSLSLSAVGRNLFFLYNGAPFDPDVSLSTSNGLTAFEVFNLPSTRQYGVSLKLNF